MWLWGSCCQELECCPQGWSSSSPSPCTYLPVMPLSEPNSHSPLPNQFSGMSAPQTVPGQSFLNLNPSLPIKGRENSLLGFCCLFFCFVFFFSIFIKFKICRLIFCKSWGFAVYGLSSLWGGFLPWGWWCV